MKKITILLLILCISIILISTIPSCACGDASITYQFNHYISSSRWKQPKRAFDNSVFSYSYLEDYSHNYLQAGLNYKFSDRGDIKRVRMRIRGSVDNNFPYTGNAMLTWEPIFSSGQHGGHDWYVFRTDRSTYTGWFDITSIAKSPSNWEWTDIANLNIYIKLKNPTNNCPRVHYSQLEVLYETCSEEPSKVTGLTVSNEKDGTLYLKWDATDDTEHYIIYRDHEILTKLDLTTYQDMSLVIGQTYAYQISAVDFLGNEGEKSDKKFGTPTNEPPNKPPIADILIESTIGIVNEEITFNGSNSYDPDGYIMGYMWDFGDGMRHTTWSESPIVVHNYHEPKMYNVILSVIDNNGLADIDTITIEITEPPNKPPSKATINGPLNGFSGIKYVYSIVSTDIDNNNIIYNIDWGDNTTTSSLPLPSNKSFIRNHNWKDEGNYTITVTSSDNEHSSVSSINISIKEPISYKKIPGFETTLVIFAIGISLILFWKRKNTK